MPIEHVVKQGECIDSIALSNGFHWETLWYHDRNKSLRDTRKDPFVLLTGDEVFVPDLRETSEPRQTDTLHRFRRLSVPSRFRIQVCVGDEALADQPFAALIDGVMRDGRTDGEGWVEFPLSPDAVRGELWVGAPEDEEREHILLDFGCLDPVTEISGLQQRLINTGFSVGEEGVLDEDTRSAIGEFQQMMDVEVTGDPDEYTLDLLVKFHGS